MHRFKFIFSFDAANVRVGFYEQRNVNIYYLETIYTFYGWSCQGTLNQKSITDFSVLCLRLARLSHLSFVRPWRGRRRRSRNGGRGERREEERKEREKMRGRRKR